MHENVMLPDQSDNLQIHLIRLYKHLPPNELQAPLCQIPRSDLYTIIFVFGRLVGTIGLNRHVDEYDVVF